MAAHAMDITAYKGMVTSDNPQATGIGRDVLLRGGNAIDAAVATALAQAVLKPSSNGIAGYGGTMVIYLAEEKRVAAVDLNCRAPAAATQDMFELEPGWESYGVGAFPPVAGKANFIGPLAVSVPATVAGLSLAHREFGRLGWADVMEPTIELAEEGFVVYPGLAVLLQGLARENDRVSVEAIFPGGRFPAEGEVWVQPDLADLLRVLAKDPDAFYRGEPARIIVDRVRSMGGILTEKDMADFRLEVADPLWVDYRGYRIYACPGVTGSPTALETLAILRELHPDPYSPDDAGYWGDLADAITLAWRDRFAYLGDVPGIDGTIRELTSDDHARRLADAIRDGGVADNDGRELDTSTCTTNLTACDHEHNLVAITQTHGGGWGSRVAVPGLGIALGHGMSRFDPRPGLPNSPGPRKSPLHNMAPLIITRDDLPVATFGLPGGRTIGNVVAQIAVDMIDFGMTPAQAICRPRIHTELGPVHITSTLSGLSREAISGRGYEIKEFEHVGGSVSGIRLTGDRIIGAAQYAPDAAAGL